MTPTFYEGLSLDHDVDERGIKSRFRRLAAQHHPDKNVGVGSTNQDEYFNYLKTAQDTLLDPAKRWAYERFGPDVLSWAHCKSIKDYFYAGLTATGPYYALGALFMVLLSWLGYIHWGKFVRVSRLSHFPSPFMPTSFHDPP
jgi:curved DNA-binding protein CbpA